jgi:hypothetical protein
MMMASFFLLFRSKEMEEQKHETCLAQLFGPLAAFFWRLLKNPKSFFFCLFVSKKSSPFFGRLHSHRLTRAVVSLEKKTF